MTPAVRVFVGLGIPFIAVVPTIPILSLLGGTAFGLPLQIVWLFACIPITSACLAFCWFLHDRHSADDEPQ